MIRVKPDWVLATKSLGSLDARAKARWVLGSQGPGFPGEDNEESKRRRRISRSTNQVKLDVSKWVEWTLGRRPGHRSIWTVFVFDGYDLFPSFRLWWRQVKFWLCGFLKSPRRAGSWERGGAEQEQGEWEEDPRQSRERLSRWQERLRRGSQGYAPPIGANCQKSFLSAIRLQYLIMHCRASRLKVPWRNARKTVGWPWRLCSAD